MINKLPKNSLSIKVREWLCNKTKLDSFVLGIKNHSLIGKKNEDGVVSSTFIKKKIGLSGEDVRAIVHRLRTFEHKDYSLIGSLSGRNSGYYWCRTPEDFDPTIAHLTSRLIALSEALSAVKRLQYKMKTGTLNNSMQEDMFNV